MDTIENITEPVGGEGATSSQDTSAQVDTQPVETPGVVSANEGTEAGEAPKTLLAGKFNSPEELEKAYLESQKLHGTLGQKAKVADLLQEKYGVSPEQWAQIIANQEAEEKRQRYADNPLAPVLDEVQELRQIIEKNEQEKAQAVVDKEIDEFLRENEVYAPFKDKIKQLAVTKGIGFDESGDRPIKDIADEFFGQAIASGQNGAYKKIETKKMAQLTPSVSTPKKTFTEDDMRGMSLDELRAILPRAN